MKVRTLSELKTLKKAMAARAAQLAAQRAAEEAARLAAQQRQHTDRLLFERAVGAVHPLPHPGRHVDLGAAVLDPHHRGADQAHGGLPLEGGDDAFDGPGVQGGAVHGCAA